MILLIEQSIFLVWYSLAYPLELAQPLPQKREAWESGINATTKGLWYNDETQKESKFTDLYILRSTGSIGSG
jgi:hypothetical protein